MTHADTLKGALIHLCARTSQAWQKAAKNGSDDKMVCAQRLSIVAEELARKYEDVCFQKVLDKSGIKIRKGSGLKYLPSIR